MRVKLQRADVSEIHAIRVSAQDAAVSAAPNGRVAKTPGVKHAGTIVIAYLTTAEKAELEGYATGKVRRMSRKGKFIGLVAVCLLSISGLFGSAVLAAGAYVAYNGIDKVIAKVDSILGEAKNFVRGGMNVEFDGLLIDRKIKVRPNYPGLDNVYEPTKPDCPT